MSPLIRQFVTILIPFGILRDCDSNPRKSYYKQAKLCDHIARWDFHPLTRILALKARKKACYLKYNWL